MFLTAIPFPAIDPILIEIGPVAIRWYSLAYIAGLLLGWAYIRRLISNEDLWAQKPPLTLLQTDDFLMWTAFGVILGGRLGYTLFYNFAYYIDNPIAILQVWNGGMSFHGAMLGVTLSVLIFCRRNKLTFLSVIDLITASVPIGLLFGRIANFINAELYGRTTDVPWGVIFPNGGPDPRHPSQLYEAFFEGLVLFILIRFLIYKYKILKKPGFTSGLFLVGYGASRIFVEFFRMPDAHIGYLFGNLTMGMILSIPMIAFGLGLIWFTKTTTDKG